MNLRIPGPTPVPDSVLKAMAQDMINHRGPEFSVLLQRITAKLKAVFQTENDLFILTGSGTGAMEAAVVNVLYPGERVLVAANGFFGERFADVARAFGADVVPLGFPWGAAVDASAVDTALARDPSITTVFVTHNETSTGITNDLGAIARVVKARDRLLVVDAVSSLGAIDLPVDKWGCDVVLTCSQKAWMVPPGLAFVSVSPRAWEAAKKAKLPRYYWDFAQAKKFLEHHQTPATPAVSLMFALDKALDLMEAEGIQNVFRRHERIGEYTRREIVGMGLGLLAADVKYASNTVTAVNVPQNINGRELLRVLRTEYDVVMAPGQGPLTEKIIRVTHLGYVNEMEMEQALRSLREALLRLGFAPGRLERAVS